MHVGRFAGVLIAGCVGVGGCAAEDELFPDHPVDVIDTVDGSEQVFDPNHVLEVDIEIDEADWDLLRVQGRTIIDVLLGDCTAEPFPKPYTFFHATVTVDGETLEYDAGVRKKGFIGSLSETKPSLKIDFTEYAPLQRYRGVERLTLNNQRQDPGYLNACMAYQRFRAAGLPAPRCNFAHVTLNGEDMGIYANVESIKEDFLERQFGYGNGDGNLYEGTLSDFRDEWRGTIEKKNNEVENDFSDVDALVAAVQDSSDADLIDELGPILDVDAYIDFWAMEVLIGHWDGYAGNRNNFFFYNDPNDGRFRFIPWGADAVFRGGQPFGEGPTSVVAHGHLARRLYLNPDTQAEYVATMNELLDTVWDEDYLLSEVDRMEALIVEYVAATDGLEAFDGALANMREFIRTRRAAIEGELAGTPPAWTAPIAGPPCMEPLGAMDATFDTEFGTLGGDPFNPGTGTIALELDGSPVAMNLVGSVAGPGEEPGQGVVAVVGALPDGAAAVAYFTMPLAEMKAGAQFEIDWGAVFGALFRIPPGGGQSELIGYFAGGTLKLDSAATVNGAPVAGSIAGSQVVSPPFQAARVLPGGADLAVSAPDLLLELE